MKPKEKQLLLHRFIPGKKVIVQLMSISHSQTTSHHSLNKSLSFFSMNTAASIKNDADMQELDLLLGPKETFSPVLLRGSSFAKFSLMERRDSNISPSLASPSEGRSRRMSQYLRDSAGRVAMDSPEVFEIPGFEPRSPSPPPPLEQEIRQRRTTMDLFKTFSSNVLEAEAGQLEALMDTYQSKKLEASYSHDADDFKDDREHLSVMFRKAVIDARKKRSAHDSAAFTSKISPEDVVALMDKLGESVKLAQVIAFLQPAGYNVAVGPCVSFDDFFGWWCYYQKKVAAEESNGQLTSRSQ
jgi:hypothetical protein